MPGVHHPISNWDIDLNNYSDCIILSWNYAEYLKQKLQEKDFKGKIFVPFPNLKLIN
jgi:hypothetical protein